MLLYRLWTALRNLWPWGRPRIDGDTDTVGDDWFRSGHDKQARFWQELREGQREADARSSRTRP
jgi:hypothetical protein